MLRYHIKFLRNVHFISKYSFINSSLLLSPSTQLLNQYFTYRQLSSSNNRSEVFTDAISSKKTSSNPSKSTIHENQNNVNNLSMDGNLYEIKYPHEEYFISKSPNIHNAREGAYISIDNEDMKKYLPEGLPRGLQTEFTLTNSNMMMVRDMHKVMCRLIEEYEEKHHPSLNPNTQKNGTTSSYATRLHLQGLTNRPEWPKSIMKTFYYGKELVIPRKWAVEPLSAVKGPDSTSEKTITNILSAAQSIPNKIMLTGI